MILQLPSLHAPCGDCIGCLRYPARIASLNLQPSNVVCPKQVVGCVSQRVIGAG